MTVALVPFASAQDLSDVTDEMLEGFGSWDAMCEVIDCDLIPMRHDTYVIGPNVYYFPDWRLTPERTGSGATAYSTGYVERSSEDPDVPSIIWAKGLLSDHHLL